MKQKILGTGLNGLVGSRIVELLSEYEFENISRQTGVDITNYNQINNAIGSSEAKIVVHFAAYTDVKRAESEKDMKEKSEAWRVNVIGTENIAESCYKNKKKLIYISTDLVFDGENIPKGGYREEDKENPLSWYAKTKYEGEKRVKNNLNEWIIIRIAYPYRSNFTKIDFVRLFIQKLTNKETLTVLTDRIITPTFIDDIAIAVNKLIEQNLKGIFHVVGSDSLSIYDCAKTIVEVFGLDNSLIKSTTRAEFLPGRAPEPFDSSLNNGKIRSLGVKMSGFKEGLRKIKRQISNL